LPQSYCGSKWQAIATWRSTHLPKAHTEAIDGVYIGPQAMRNGRSPGRTSDRDDAASDPLWTDFRARFGALAPRMLVHADLFLRRQGHRDVCIIIVSRAARVHEQTQQTCYPSRGSYSAETGRSGPTKAKLFAEAQRLTTPEVGPGHGRNQHWSGHRVLGSIPRPGRRDSKHS
jgi:hypothetical protein